MEPAKLKGWIAKNGKCKDKDYLYVYDNNIVFSEIIPTRDLYNNHWNFAKFYLEHDLFPDLKWEDDPVPVELVIKPTIK